MFLRTPAMRWTHHMEECLQHLIDHPEVPGDTALTIIVRVDRLLEDVVTAGSWRWDLQNPDHSELPSPILYVNSLRANLKAIVEDSPTEALSNSELLSCFHPLNPLNPLKGCMPSLLPQTVMDSN